MPSCFPPCTRTFMEGSTAIDIILLLRYEYYLAFISDLEFISIVIVQTCEILWL